MHAINLQHAALCLATVSVLLNLLVLLRLRLMSLDMEIVHLRPCQAVVINSHLDVAAQVRGGA